MIDGFPEESLWISLGDASHDIRACGCVDAANEFAFTVGSIMASDDAVAMRPSVTGRIEACHPCRPMELWTSSAICCGRRSNGGRGGCRAGGRRIVEFGYQR